MSTRAIGLFLIIVGIVVALIAILADYLGLGIPGQTIFGWKQQLGAAGGAIVVIIGILLTLRKPAPKK